MQFVNGGKPQRTGWLSRLATRVGLVATLVVSSLAPITPTMVRAADEPDEAIVEGDVTIGRHYRQAGGDSGNGYDVVNPFYSAMKELGGVDWVGYPVSSVFPGTDGCQYQAFQRFLLQRCKEGPVVLANTFQVLEETGANAFLQSRGIGGGEDDRASSFDGAVSVRLAWLKDKELAKYFMDYCGEGVLKDAWAFCGLPMNTPRLFFGQYVSQRFQRLALQRWVADGPGGIKAGAITIVNGGDLLKEAAILTGLAVTPHPKGKPPTGLAQISLVTDIGAAPPAAAAPVAQAPVQAPAPPPPAPAKPTPAPVAPAPGAPASPGVAALAPIPGMVLPPGRTLPMHFGYQGDFFSPQVRTRGIEAIQQSGFQWAKQQVVWSQYEQSSTECAKEPGNCFNVVVNGRTHSYRTNQFSYLDAVMAELSKANLNILLSVVHAPDFLAAPGGHSPADPDQLRDFVTVVVNRYKGKVRAVEPWNEQNLAGEWGASRMWPNAPAAPPQGVVDFLALMKSAYVGVKSADQSVIVVLPALTPTGVGECWLNPDVRASGGCIDQVKIAIDDRLYLDLLYQVNGGEISRYFDVLGVHPSGYNNPPDDTPEKKTVSSTGFKGHPSFYIRRFQQLREVQQKYGDNKPMWFTEVGWSVAAKPVSGYEYATENSEAQRAKYIARLLELVYNEAPYVTNVIIWNLNFRQIVPETDEKYGFGLLEANGSPTLSFQCAADFVKSGGKVSQPVCR